MHLAVALRHSFPNEFMVLLGLNRIIRFAGYSSPGGCVDLQRLEGYSAAAAYRGRLLLFGSYRDHCCNVDTCKEWWRQLQAQGEATVISRVYEHGCYDWFLEGVMRGKHGEEVKQVAVTLQHFLDPDSDVGRGG